MKKILSKLPLILFGVFIGLLIGEVVLRIYNPFPTRVVGNSLRLLKNYKRTINIPNYRQQAGIDEYIHYSTNAIGFRGAEPPSDFSDHYTIFTVGGSTTESSLLDDSKTWTHVLNSKFSGLKNNIWMNNAGIDGCSTFGHEILLNEHIFDYSPDMILFLVGVNEVHVASSDEDIFINNSRNSHLRNLAQKSELFLFLWNLYGEVISPKKEVGHHTLKLLNDLSKKEFEKQHTIFLNDQKKYKLRLNNLVKDCIDRNIKPVLITQPIYKGNNFHSYYFVNYYNQTTIEVAKENDVFVIDLASKLEDNSDYYYDIMHYTNIGSAKVAEIIYSELANTVILAEQTNR